MPMWLEFVAFQVVWFACVLGAAHGMEWIGCAGALAFTCAVRAREHGRARSVLAACGAGALGSAVDALFRARGWIIYDGRPFGGVWAPVWIVALWIAFAATLASSLRWLRGRAWLSVPFAALGAPLSYAGAERLGAVEIGAPRWSSLGGIGLGWIAALHAAAWLHERLLARRELGERAHHGNVLVAAGALALLAVPVTGCTSMKKDVLGQKLLALEKNRAVREAGVQVADARVRIEGREVAATFRYHRAGERGRPVIVLVHGTPSSLFTWTELVHGAPGFDGLARDFDVVALDVLGHSATATRLDHYSFQACADWVSGFLDTLDLRDVTLVGQSYGGEFAWRAAVDRPERVARVVLMNSSGAPRRAEEWLPEEVKLREWRIARFGWLVNSRSRLLSALQPHFEAPVPKERLEEYFLVCENSDNWSACVDLARDENGARVEELRELRAPVLLLWGARDIAYPPQRFATEFEKRLPDVRLVLVPSSGHYPHEEAPAVVVRELRAFVAETARSK